MARRAVFAGLTILGVVALPLALMAEEAKRPERPAPDVMFNRLDANHDGRISADEVPPGAPEKLKQLLAKADKNGDKQVTPEELKAAIQEQAPWIDRGMGPRFGGGMKPGSAPGRGRPDRGPGAPPGKPPFGPGIVGPPGAFPGPGPHAGGLAGPPGKPPFGPGLKTRPGPPMPDLGVLFVRMDRDGDGGLSVKEFVEGMTFLRAGMTGRFAGPPAAEAAKKKAGGKEAKAEKTVGDDD